MSAQPKIAIIGGSGLYSMPGITDVTGYEIDTPFGKPSSRIIVGTLESQRVAFLARHGEGHRLSPSEVPYRANIYALKTLGVERVVSVSACGSLRDDYKPGDIVIPEQLFDFTRSRPRTFFEGGFVAHISCADPFCSQLSRLVFQAVEAADGNVHLGGALITIEGPRFSTRIETNTFRAWGLSLINMTSVPETFLAREAEMCYAVMNHVTDYDVWHVTEEAVSVKMLIDTLNRNTELAKEAIRQLVRTLPADRDCECENALASALITQPDVISDDTRKRLEVLIEKYL